MIWRETPFSGMLFWVHAWALTIRPKIPRRISGNFHGQMIQSFSSVEDDNCSLGIFYWLLGLNHKYRSEQITDESTSWLFIDHNSRDLVQTTTAAKTSQNKGFTESYNGSANLCTFPSQPMKNKQVTPRGIRDLKHQQRNGTTTTGGSKIFPREGSAHVRCCQNVV